MKNTPARAQVKKHLGQANHFMITSLVGLHHLEASDVVEAPAELHTSWNPHNKTASTARSRIFVLQSSLGWAVDSLDMYISLLNRKPDYIRNPALKSEIDGAGRSVYKKVFAVGYHYKISGDILALVDVLITWRNNVFHQLGDNILRQSSIDFLLSNEAEIQRKYRGLSPALLPKKAASGDILTFKETASLISAAQHFSQEVDEAIIADLDLRTFCEDLIEEQINGPDRSVSFTSKYFSITPSDRSRFVSNWLQNNYGISGVSSDILAACCSVKKSSSS